MLNIHQKAINFGPFVNDKTVVNIDLLGVVSFGENIGWAKTRPFAKALTSGNLSRSIHDAPEMSNDPELTQSCPHVQLQVSHFLSVIFWY